MSKTAYILRCGSRLSLVWTDDERNQSTTPLGADMAPAHTAFERGTSDETILRLARHPGGARYALLFEVAVVHGMSEEAAFAARSRGINVERAARAERAS